MTKKYRYKMVDSIDGSLNRLSQIAEIKENVSNFVMDILSDFEVEGIPNISVDRLVGFEKIKPIKNIKGYIVVNASLEPFSGVTIRLSVPVPVYNGEFLRPSMMTINGKKSVLSKAALNEAIDDTVTVKPTVKDIYGANPAYQHEEVIGRGEFASFPKPVEWDEPLFDLIGNRSDI